MDFNRDWLFSKEGVEPIHIDLPHDAMLTEMRDEHCINGKQSGYFPGGKYTYEKCFIADAADIGKSIGLLFEGVYQNCKVEVNGKVVGTHKYGYTPFAIDISEAVKAGENTVTVHVDNSLEPNCRWYSGSGIYRPVHLVIRDRLHIQTVHIETVSIAPAVINVAVTTSETTQEAPVQVEIYNGDALLISGKPGELTIGDAKLWSAETPHLYTCVVKLPADERRVDFGVRKLEWSAKTGLLVNGEEVLLRGGCVHHDHGVLGACCFQDAEERRVRILKEAGYNAIRCAHNPASRALLDACDRIGMYVMDEAFDGWYTPKNYHDYSRWFFSEWQNDITAMVENSRNHPCVIMYSIGNEVTETSTEKGAAICKELADFVRSLDQTRPVTCGINVLLNVFDSLGIGVYKDKGNYKPEPLPPRRKKYREKKTGSTFYNAMAQRLGALMFHTSSGKKGDRVTRSAAEGLDILGLNYAASRYDTDAMDYPERMMVGSETIAEELPYNWARVLKYKALIGDFVWAAWDYLGEAGVGDWTYYAYPGLLLLAGSGTIDLTGKIGAEAFFQQFVWGLRNEPYIGVRPLNHTGEIPVKSTWRFTNAIDSWNWQGFEGKNAFIEVYSNAHAVRLLLNGKVIGTKNVSNFRVVFKTSYQPGTLTAEALNGAGEVISAHSLKSGGMGTILTVRADKTQLQANGQDLCYLEIEFTDTDHQIKPYIEQRVELDVIGAVTLAGFGSALCKTDEVFDKTYHNSHRGRALAVLRAGYEPGNATVSVKSSGMQPVTIDLVVN